MTLLLNSEEVERLISMEACLEALEMSFRELAEGTAVNRPRTDTFTRTSEKDVFYRYKSMEGLVPGAGVQALRINSEKIRWPKVMGQVRQDKFQRVYPNHYVGIVLLFSIESGELLAIIKEAFIQKMRVGGTSGLGIKYLSRKDADRIGILGSGWQASVQLMAACAVRDIQHVKVYSPNPDNRKKFSQKMSKLLGVEMAPVDTARDAATDVDILLAATNTMEPVLKGEWVKPGMHVSSINTRREIDENTIRTSDYIVVNTREVGYTIYVAGSADGVVPLQEKDVEVSAYPEIGEVIVGKARGRKDAEEKTLFLSNIGLGTQFAAVAAKVYREAKAQNVGQEISSDWFLETVKK